MGAKPPRPAVRLIACRVPGQPFHEEARRFAARKVRARTLESYRTTVRLHLRPGVGHQRLDRLQPEHLERLYATLADKGLSPASILRAHRVLSRALKVASQRGKVARNVATLVDPPVVKRPETALPLSAQEVRRVMAAAQAHRNAARWTVARE